MSLPKVRGAVAEENGYDGRSWWRRRRATRVQTLYRTVLDEAEMLGVFGAPTFVLEGERFWGQDRLEFLDRALDAIRARGERPNQQ